MPPIGSHKSTKTDGLKASLGASGTVGEWSATQNQVAAQLMTIYTSAGMSKAGAAGLIGNQMQESGLDPNAPGGGLSQWIGARGAAMRSYASSIAKPANSVEAQGNFAVQELRTGYPQLWSYLTTASDPAAAALAISNQYERPAAWAANNANRQRQAQLAFSGVAGAPVGNTGNTGNSGGGGGSGFSPLDALVSFATGDFQTLAGQFASLAFTMLKDTAIGIGDLLIVPWWHWNQRAVQNYWYMMTDPTQAVWMLPGTAVFWGFGYWLLWTDPDQKGFAPQPVQRSRLARHVRAAQAVPARFDLVKPKDVGKRTIRKPKPTISRAEITQTGTMRATRVERVTVSGQHRSITDSGDTSNVSIERAGTAGRKSQQGQFGQVEDAADATHRESNAEHRAGRVPLSRRGTAIGTHPTSGRGTRNRA
jgi:hypothetical protein